MSDESDDMSNNTDKSSESFDNDRSKHIKKNLIEKCNDTDVGERIRYDPPKLVKHRSKYIADGYGCFILICGRTGCGKTVVLRTIAPMMSDDIKYIIIASRVRDNPVHKVILEWAKSKGKKGIMVHEVDEYNEAIGETINNKKKNDGMLIIFDDFTEYKTRQNEFTNAQVVSFSQLRNYNACGISIQQQYCSFDTFLRCNSKIKIIFPMCDRHSVIAVRQEFTNLFGYAKKEELDKIFNDWYDYICNNKFKFLCMYSDPPKLTLGFGEKQIYPPQEKTKLDITNPPVTENKRGAGLRSRGLLRRTAVDLGLPAYRVNQLTDRALQEYIKVKSADAQDKIGNDNPQIKEILNEKTYPLSQKTLLSRFYRSLVKYKNTQNKDYLDQLKISINALLDNGHVSKDEILYKLQKYGIDKYFKFN